MNIPVVRRLSIWLPLLLAIATILVLLHTLASTSARALASQGSRNGPVLERLHPSLWQHMQQVDRGELIAIIIEWHSPGIDALAAQTHSPEKDAVQQRQQLITTLQANAQAHTQGLQQMLAEAQMRGEATQARVYWVSPVIAVQANPALIEQLSQDPAVAQIRLDEPIYLEEDQFAPFEGNAPSQAVQWNLSMVQVDLAQQALGLDGTGVVVANLDTGVDWQHPALMKQYRGYNPNGPPLHLGNWFVVTGEPYLYPGDGIGHGTHTMGSMVGDDGQGNRTGVAPGARWIAVKVFNNDGITYESWLHSAFEWILAPAGNPALAPDVVNNSWGSRNGSDTRFQPDVAALLAAGILPIFSAGNSGPQPRTVGSPGSYPGVLAVGAVDELKATASFSSRGPNPWGDIKPEIVAPGVQIRSTFPGGGYALFTGTSMATPLVAGAAALLLQANPDLTPDEIVSIIKNTAEPLGDTVPNQNTGWGLLNAYAAGIQVTGNGIVSGQVKNTTGTGIPYATVTARSHPEVIPSRVVTLSVDDRGGYQIALQPGRYSLTAQAFGYTAVTWPSVIVLTGTHSTENFLLSPLPTGLVSGTVRDLVSGLPISATLSVPGTPVTALADPVSGVFQMALPAGTWPVLVEAVAHRSAHFTPTVTVEGTQVFDLALERAPRILLVDSGQWYYGSEIGYYEFALQALDYPYTLWPIHYLGDGEELDQRPKPGDLDPYEIVIWSDPEASPGYIGMNDVITSYLDQSGNLLLSGQEILELDGGGVYFMSAAYTYHHLGLSYQEQGPLSPLTGMPGSPLEGLQVNLNTADSAQQQKRVDAGKIINAVTSQAALSWADGSLGAATAGVCRPYRAAWLGFGLEGAGPASVRTEVMQRLINWFQSDRAAYGIQVSNVPEQIIGLAGQVVTGTITLDSVGVLTDDLALTVSGGPWPIVVNLPDGSSITQQGSLQLPSCQQVEIEVAISIPANEPKERYSHYTIEFASQNNPAVSTQVHFEVKTPAPVLLVDTHRWYDHIQPYRDTLHALGVPFDTLDGLNAFLDPASADRLAPYSQVIWITGYNWFDPLDKNSQTALANYLDGGGMLLITSQDLLDTVGESTFVKTRLGVLDYTLSITPSEVHAAEGSLLGEDLGPLQLSFPYPNWGDGIEPDTAAKVLLIEGNLYPVGIGKAANTWRTLFYSFPLETLDTLALQTVLRRSLAWLNPLGESRLQAPPAAMPGSTLPVTLTLQLTGSPPASTLQAVLPLPPGSTLLTDTLQGGWVYQPDQQRIFWTGSLLSNTAQQLTAQLSILETLAPGSQIPLQANLSWGDGLTVTLDREVAIGLPWLSVHTSSAAQTLQAGHSSPITLTVTNQGVTTNTTTLTIRIPAELQIQPISGTSQAMTGWLTGTQYTWQTTLGPAGQVDYSFWVLAADPQKRVALRLDAKDALSSHFTGWVFHVFTRYYLPIVFR